MSEKKHLSSGASEAAPLWKMKKLPEPVIIAAAAVAGLIAFPLLKS